jgi:hypothetical protein
VNKNNYTLTYSGHGAMGSFIASMITSGAIGQNIGNYFFICILDQNSELFTFEIEVQNYLQLKPSEMEI